MTQPFIGQIQPFGFGFAPRTWAQCNGQILSIQQSTALFSLLGTMYGGNGQTTFGLPNLQSRVPLHAGTSPGGEVFFQGEQAGVETVTLTLNTMPAHNHNFLGTSTNADVPAAADNASLGTIHQASANGDSYYAPDTTPQPLNPGSIATVGGSQAHDNIQPYQTINWCIAMSGIFPSRG
jgi:microcystin-dependent protein